MSEEYNIDFAELTKDANFKSTIIKFHKHIDKIGEIFETACNNSAYDQLGLEDKVKYDLFMAYSMNSLFWLYLRTQGLDPSKHDLKSEIDRVRNYNVRAKQVYDRKYIMPRIDKGAAQRFVKHGLWDPNKKNGKESK